MAKDLPDLIAPLPDDPALPPAPSQSIVHKDLTPEARYRRTLAHRMQGQIDRLRPGARPFEVLKRAAVGVYYDGFIHAGNLAYLSLLSLFPFFIVMAAFATLLGQSSEANAMIANVLDALPRNVVQVIQPAIHEMLQARTGSLLWLGALVGLWSVGSLIETIRDILRRAYGTTASRPFWHYRLGSVAMTITAVFLLFLGLFLTVMLTAIQHAIYELPRIGDEFGDFVAYSKIVPGLVLFGSLYGLFRTLTPGKYKANIYPKWPGAAFTAAWWMLMTAILPWALGHLTNYDLTYGSLAGVIIALLFFWLVGFGLVFGAELNAALADVPVDDYDGIGQSDDRKRQETNKGANP